MPRRTRPLDIKYPSASAEPIVVGAVPTFATKRRYGYNGLLGIFTAGNLADVIPVQHPIIPWESRAFPYVLPSDVAPDSIRKTIMTAINLFSPSGHSKAAHTDEPVPAIQPDPYDVGSTMPKKSQRGTGGHYP